jgi:anti-sigma regulatory factor (Ser/Thr protein kinase)
MEIALSLRLPRDRLTVPVVRHIVRSAVEEIGVDPDCAHELELVLSEACTNVLLHAGGGDLYDVRLTLDGERCELQVIDAGPGVDRARLRRPRTTADAERGRGLLLMSALVDRVHFSVRPPRGTVVSMEKSLVYTDRSLLKGESPGDGDVDLRA